MPPGGGIPGGIIPLGGIPGGIPLGGIPGGIPGIPAINISRQHYLNAAKKCLPGGGRLYISGRADATPEHQ